MNPAQVATSLPALIRLEIPAVAEWVAVARLAVAAVASRSHFSVDEIEDIKLAIAESCTNAIQHGEGGTIEIVCEAADDHLQVTVRDRGTGPRLGTVKGEERITEMGRTEELGVFLIRALMDDVEYTSDPRTGTQLVMRKHVTR
jgi:serine/threonine-protein kinase RsbW